MGMPISSTVSDTSTLICADTTSVSRASRAVMIVFLFMFFVYDNERNQRSLAEGKSKEPNVCRSVRSFFVFTIFILSKAASIESCHGT